MKKLLLAIGLLIITSTIGCSQNKLTQKQIEKRNYQEVIGNKSNSKDTIIPDKYAMYPDGMKGINKHIKKNMTYPSNAYKRGIQGKVILRFTVEKDGKVEEIEVLESIDPELDAEAIRVLRKLKIWVPGYKDGKPVRIKYTFPFNFKY